MKDFIDVAEDLFFRKAFGDRQGSIEKVFQAINELQMVFSKSFLDLNNIEHVFGAIELAMIIRSLGKFGHGEIAEIRNALVTMIVRTLEEKVTFPQVSEHASPTHVYNLFVTQLKRNMGSNFSIITFNYDIALDFALYAHNIQVNYCLDPTSTSGSKLLKLHGSTNWGSCGTCHEIIPYALATFLHKYTLSTPPGNPFCVRISNHLQDLKEFHKQHDTFEETPVIVPPTWNKTEYHGTLSHVWSEAAKELSSARNIYVIGYSLPETDSFFRYLFALGTIGTTRIRRFWVCNRNTSEDFEERYKRLIGQGIADRLQFLSMSFEEALPRFTS